MIQAPAEGPLISAVPATVPLGGGPPPARVARLPGGSIQPHLAGGPGARAPPVPGESNLPLCGGE